MGSFLLLIDGSSLLTTQFFGNLPREIMFAKTQEEKEAYYHKIMMTSQGVYTNAVFGFMRTLMKILKEQKPSHLAVAWDLSRNTFRRELYPDYKGNRGETMKPLKDQFILCQQVLEEMGIVQLMDERYEADDFCGTAAKQFEDQLPVRILTKDNDYLQLVTEQTNLWMMHSTAEKTDELFKKYRIDKQEQDLPERVFCFTPELVEKEFGIRPCFVNSLKGLMGDSSDNIKGVPGVGKETAVRLIQEYGTIENLYAAIDHLDKAGEKAIKEYWKEKLGLKRSPLAYLLKESETDLVGRKAAFLSEKLATIVREVPFHLSLDDLKTAVNADAARAAFERLEFHSIKADFGEEEEKKDPWPMEQMNEISDLGEAADAVAAVKKSQSASLIVAADQGEVRGLCLFDQERCIFIRPVSFITEDQLKFWAEEILQNVPAVYVPDAKQLFHLLQCREYPSVRDVGIAAYLLDPLKSSYPLEELAQSRLDWRIDDYGKLFGKQKVSEVSETDEYARWIGRLAVTAGLVGPMLEKELEETDMLSLYRDVEMPLAYDLYRMEKTGIQVRQEALVSYGEELIGGIRQLEEEICELAGTTFNILSPKQLGEVLFEKLKLPYGKKTKSGYSTAADVLEKLSADYPIVDKVLQYRQLTKLKSTYADGLAACISSDGRIHGTFNQTITATGRISSTEPNLQNIPVRMELGRAIRKVFVPAEGCVFLDADYSQIELRVLAHMSEDENLIRAYQDAQDIHATTASQVFHVPLEEVTPLMRRNAKAVNFGIVYGISAFGLSEDLSITRKEALEYIDRYFETYPGVKAFLDRMVKEGQEKEFVTTMFGRRRPIPELKSANYMQRQFGERVAMNSPIQGTAADIMKIAMIRVNRRLEREGCRAKVVLQVHDELLLETPTEEKEKVAAVLKEEMQSAAALSVALEVSLSEGASWYETK
ncbi:MAG: DNA polymerase I [Lachnospiraceae bacterium]|nr:DNA polymerase I [Lachnospiraceae bacterium]